MRHHTGQSAECGAQRTALLLQLRFVLATALPPGSQRVPVGGVRSLCDARDVLTEGRNEDGACGELINESPLLFRWLILHLLRVFGVVFAAQFAEYLLPYAQDRLKRINVPRVDELKLAVFGYVYTAFSTFLLVFSASFRCSSRC